MKNKFILTEEESKRILSLHKQKIQEERGNIQEDDENIDQGFKNTRIGGSALAGAGTGAGIGALVTLGAGGVGAIPGAIIGAGVGALTGWLTVGGGYYDRVAKAFKFCRDNRKNMGKPVNSREKLEDIADFLRTSVTGVGTDEMLIAKNLRKLKTIPDFCALSKIYYERFTETLLEALDGDIDQDKEWRDYVWLPLSELAKNTPKVTDEKLKENAKKCGWGDDIEGYRKSGWRCPKSKTPTPTPPIPPVPVVPPRPGRKRYYFNYQDAVNALNKKGCPTGGGGEEGKKEDGFADDWRVPQADQKVDPIVSSDDFSNWSK